MVILHIFCPAVFGLCGTAICPLINIICEVETMKEPLVITMAREYASGGSEIAQKVADLLGIPLYNKELA